MISSTRNYYRRLGYLTLGQVFLCMRHYTRQYSTRREPLISTINYECVREGTCLAGGALVGSPLHCLFAQF